MRLHRLYFLSAVVAILATTACEDVDEDESIFDVKPTGAVDPDAKGNDEVSDIPLTRYTSRLEIPALKRGNTFIEHSTLEGRDSIINYSLEYSPEHHHSRWVAFRFDATNRAVNVNRKEYNIRPQYPIDPELKSCLTDDASFSGYQHGHLCASNDRRYSRDANDQTFYMSNMSPQSSNFNGTYWTLYESFVQTLGRTENFSDTLYVVKGGTLDQTRATIRVDGFSVPVPKYYWMALLRVKGSSYAAVGFWMEHRDDYADYSSDPRPEILNHAVSIDQLETLTGINFFPNLPDDVEKSVEASYTSSTWGL